LIVIFVSVWGETANSVVSAIRDCSADTCGLLGNPIIYSVGISVLLLPTTFMKEIAELHLVSMSLFGSALLFVVINIFQMFLR